MPKHDKARVVLRRKIQQLGEVQVRRNQTAPLAPACRGNGRILGTLKAFLEDCGDGMAGCDERRLPPWGAILIQLESHRQVVTSTGSTRSQVISAA